MIPSFTIVLGVDAKHLEQLRVVWPTWVKHKPSLTAQNVVVFYDRYSLRGDEVMCALCDLNVKVQGVIAWPFDDANPDYGNGVTKWDHPQRYKMLAGFLYVARHLETPLWLKLDTDVVATGNDNWIDPEWFTENPAIVAPGWPYTKPANQLLELDAWAEKHGLVPESDPLNLAPEPGASAVYHPRIGGWCDFFRTDFTRELAGMVERTVGPGLLPVPSLDGLCFYAAKRMNLPIKIVRTKKYGWDFKHTFGNIQEAAGRAMA